MKDYDGSRLDQEQSFPFKRHEFRYDPKTKTAEFKTAVEEEPEILPPYIPDEKLQRAVRLTQMLQRPLLIRGEPGCGKTKLAQAVAYEWYGEDYRQYYFEWHIKSTSKAQEGLYSFDHISRLRDANLKGEKASKQVEDLTKYRKFGPLGQAFAVSTAENPAIVLIDEIDKADIDFPNDLLLELDELRFKIPETGEEIQAGFPPVIFITSNQERELPAAFLRRCLYHFIEFPRDKKLLEIITANFPDLVQQQESLVNTAISRFEQLREAIDQDPNVSKNVSTSELIDWFRAMDYELKNTGTTEAPAADGAPPYHQVLLKSYNDLFREGLLKKHE